MFCRLAPTTSDAQCTVKWFGSSDCSAASGYDPATCVMTAGRCYSRTAPQCARDKQCTTAWTGECTAPAPLSSLHCAHGSVNTGFACACKLDKSSVVIVSVAPRNLPADAASKLQSFERSTAVSKWKGIPKSEVALQVKQRMASPHLVDQSSKPLCGPSAILYWLIRLYPGKYVDAMRSLVESGGMRLASGANVAASAALLGASDKRGRIPAADWIITAVMRDAGNALFKMNPADRGTLLNIQGITFPWEITGWMREVLGFKTVTSEYCITTSCVAALVRGAAAVARGGAAVLMIHTALMSTDPAKLPSVQVPEHWVGLASSSVVVDPKTGHINFDIFTWGSIFRMSIKPSQLNTSLFYVASGY
jgi:hypothetical protein